MPRFKTNLRPDEVFSIVSETYVSFEVFLHRLFQPIFIYFKSTEQEYLHMNSHKHQTSCSETLLGPADNT